MPEHASHIRVCVFSYYFPPHFSGAGLYHVSLAKALSRSGVTGFFITVDNTGLPRRDVYDGFEVYRVTSGPKKHGELVLWWNMWRVLHARRHDFDILHAAGSTYRSSIVGPFARLLGKKSVTTVSLANDDLHLVGRTAAGKLQAMMLGYVDGYVSISSQITEEIRRLPLDFGRVVEIPQGVDVDRFCPADESEKAALREREALPGGKLALYTGVLDRRKNVEWLVKTWAEYRTRLGDWRLLLVGPASRHPSDSHLASTLREFVRNEGLADWILFRDFTPRIEDYYRAADLFILPSKNEGMPNAMLEAMACGLPCLATRISGTTDLVTHGKSGMLFEVDNERDFLEVGLSLMRDPGLRREIGLQARARVIEEFSAAVVVEQYLRLYRNLLEGR